MLRDKRSGGQGLRASLRSIPVMLILALTMTLGLACLATAQSATPDLLDYPDTVLQGVAAASFEQSAEECRSVCLSRTGCAGFDHSTTTNICRLYTSISSAQPDQTSIAAARYRINGYRDPANMPQPQPVTPAVEQEQWFLARFNGVDFWGGDFGARNGLTVFDPLECARQCELNRLCRAFTYNQKANRCFLKNGYQFIELQDGGAAGLYFKAKPSEARISVQVQWQLLQNMDLPGNDLGYTVQRTYPECLQNCTSTMGCSAITWLPKRNANYCFLKGGSNLYPRYDARKGLISARMLNQNVFPDSITPASPRD